MNRSEKLIEENIPEYLHLRVVHLHGGNTSGNQRKRIARTKTEFCTIARLFDAANNLVAEGRSACSQVDNPSRSIGRQVAVGRALRSYHMTGVDHV